MDRPHIPHVQLPPERVTIDLSHLGIAPMPWQEEWTTLTRKLTAKVADMRESQLAWAVVAYLLDESMDHFETTLVIPREKLMEILSRPGVPEVIEFAPHNNAEDCIGIRIHRSEPVDDPDL